MRQSPTILNGVIRKNDINLLTSIDLDLDLGSRSFKIQSIGPTIP